MLQGFAFLKLRPCYAVSQTFYSWKISMSVLSGGQTQYRNGSEITLSLDYCYSSTNKHAYLRWDISRFIILVPVIMTLLFTWKLYMSETCDTCHPNEIISFLLHWITSSTYKKERKKPWTNQKTPSWIHFFFDHM